MAPRRLGRYRRRPVPTGGGRRLAQVPGEDRAAAYVALLPILWFLFLIVRGG
ncbi:hypothetical protein [Streptomyces sp. NPDC059850]|uniref:hypothetical protein n=1 Tax=Streptomyces sp. NPDC059850 TaxID=3346970 RepID=UPI003666AC06